MIMATGVDALAIVLNFLVIYIHGKLLKGFTDGLTKNKAEVTPEHTGKIIIYAPNGLTESAEVQKSTPQEDIRQHIEDLLNFARKYGVSQVIIRASDQSWP
jgi:hypothetical protein